MENKYIVYKSDYNKLCNYGFNDVNSILDSSVDDYISSNNILEQFGGKLEDDIINVLKLVFNFYYNVTKYVFIIIYVFVLIAILSFVIITLIYGVI